MHSAKLTWKRFDVEGESDIFGEGGIYVACPRGDRRPCPGLLRNVCFLPLLPDARCVRTRCRHYIRWLKGGSVKSLTSISKHSLQWSNETDILKQTESSWAMFQGFASPASTCRDLGRSLTAEWRDVFVRDSSCVHGVASVLSSLGQIASPLIRAALDLAVIRDQTGTKRRRNETLAEGASRLLDWSTTATFFHSCHYFFSVIVGFIMRPPNRPHCAFCLFDCPSLSPVRAFHLKTKKNTKPNLVWMLSRACSDLSFTSKNQQKINKKPAFARENWLCRLYVRSLAFDFQSLDQLQFYAPAGRK